jgi:hypothetical protein
MNDPWPESANSIVNIPAASGRRFTAHARCRISHAEDSDRNVSLAIGGIGIIDVDLAVRPKIALTLTD